jgi:menaquinone-9 beta-reductase
MPEVAIVGGGPSGLALAIAAAMRGIGVVVLERGEFPVDKACGEGVLPPGLGVLERLGVLEHLDPAECAPLRRLRYEQEDGTFAEGRLPGRGGLGIRRLALERALLRRAREVGARLEDRRALRSHRWVRGGVELQTDSGVVSARMLVAADGLSSPLRKSEGLEGRPGRRRRFGLRQHFRISPWSAAVEVHFAHGAEAYVTPAGAQRVGVALLFDPARVEGRLGFEELLVLFPRLKEQLGAAQADSRPRGAGPMHRVARSQVKDRFALVGDAAGYVDAISGEGLSLAFTGAELLADILPEALRQDGRREALLRYERGYQAAFRRYERLTNALLWMAERPGVRRRAIRVLSGRPRLFGAILGQVLG